MSKREIVADDLTGREIKEFETVTGTWGGKKYTLDLCPDSVLAMDALFTGNGSAMLGKLLASITPAPAAQAKRTRNGGKDSGNGENKAIRTWWNTPEGRAATETPEDQPIPNRGRIPAEVTTAYRAAHPAA